MEPTPRAGSMRTWCLCQICTCGSDSHPYEIVKQPHHAPEEYKPKQGEIDLGTTYKRHLNSYKVQRVAIARPLERQVKKGKLDTVPTYKESLWMEWGKYRYRNLQRKNKEYMDVLSLIISVWMWKVLLCCMQRHLSSCLLEEISPDRSTAISPS